MPIDTAEIRRRRARGAMRALIQSGEHLLGEAQRGAPIKEGTLRASGDLAFIVNGVRYADGGAATAAAVALAAGGNLHTIDAEVSFNEIYAARQHEETDWHHPLGGEAKYLERPLGTNVSRYSRALELEDRLALS